MGTDGHPDNQKHNASGHSGGQRRGKEKRICKSLHCVFIYIFKQECVLQILVEAS